MGTVRDLNAIRAEKLDDNTILTPVEALRDSIYDIEEGDRECDSLMVLFLSRGEDGHQYRVGWNVSNLKSSEMLALLEVAKMTILERMGYLQ